MKKIIFIALLVSLAISPFLAMAASTITPGTVPEAKELGVEESPITDSSGLLDVIAGVLKWVYTIFFIVAILFIILAAFNYLTAADNAEKIKSSHKQILWAIIAIAIALISVGATQIIKSFIESPESAVEQTSGDSIYDFRTPE